MRNKSLGLLHESLVCWRVDDCQVLGVGASVPFRRHLRRRDMVALGPTGRYTSRAARRV